MSRGAAAATRRVAPTDRAWLGVAYTRAYTDLDMPSVEQLRYAMRTLLVEAPEVARWLDPARGRWRRVRVAEWDTWVDRVLLADPRALDEPADVLATNEQPLADLPFRMVAGPSWFSLRVSHAIGDGVTVNQLANHLLARAGDEAGAPLPPWTVVPAWRHDLQLARELARHVGTAVHAVRHRAALRGGEYEPAGLRADALAPTTTCVVASGGFTARVREIRDAEYPGASVAAVTYVGLRAALGATLPPARPGFECLFNTRTARTTRVLGNWSVGVYLNPADDLDPLAVSTAMTSARARGLPDIAAASMRVAGQGNGEVHVVAPCGAPRLTFSFANRHGLAGGFPGRRDGRSRVHTSTRPNGVETITLELIEIGEQLNVSAAFYPQVWSMAAVNAALSAFLTDPACWLARHAVDVRTADRRAPIDLDSVNVDVNTRTSPRTHISAIAAEASPSRSESTTA